MRHARRLALGVVFGLAASVASASEVFVVDAHPMPAASRPGSSASTPSGMWLDVEACQDDGCGRASAGATIVLTARQAMPMRVRLHLDCDDALGIRGLARVARVVLLRDGTRHLDCPLEPADATCSFRFWEDDFRWDGDVVAEYFPSSVETAWPKVDHPVDEAEIAFELPWNTEPGAYELIAALPDHLVDQYDCERVREHAWEQSQSLRVVVIGEE